MRFVIAIVMFVLAAVMITVGIAQRTVLAPPDAVSHAVEITGGAPITVISGATLNAIDGRQTIELDGAATIVAAYGRTVDVQQWVGESRHAVVEFDDETGELVSTIVDGDDAEVPDPFGSDLWLDDYREEGSMRLAVTVPSDVSFVIASDGIEPAPTDVRLSWPVDNTNPIAGWFIVLGGVVLVIGLIVLLWSIHHMRSTRGPRRKMPKVPKQKPIKPQKPKPLAGGDSPRRAAKNSLVVAPAIAMVLALTAGGSTAMASTTPSPTPTPDSSESPTQSPTQSPSPTETPNAPQGDPIPAITTRQIDRIIERVVTSIAAADAALDPALAAERLTGSALELRTADYAIRTADTTIVSALPVIPEDFSVVLALPQQIPSDGAGWPRSVFVVVKAPDSEETEAQPAIGLMLSQASARENYKVESFLTLQSDIPEVAEQAIGAAKLAPDSALLSTQPAEIGADYADVLMTDTASAFSELFDLTEDTLVPLWGLASMQAIQAALPAVAQAAFTTSPTDGTVTALATFDAGAIVAVDLRQVITVTPTEAGATVSPTGSVLALSGITSSERGVVATYGAQLLFSVPPVGSTDKIVLLGYSQGLLAASEVP